MTTMGRGLRIRLKGGFMPGIALAMCLFSGAVYATTFPDISGTWTGTVSGPEFGGTGCGGTDTDTLNINITQSNGNFSGSGNSDVNEPFSLSGTIDGAGSFMGSGSGSEPDGSDPFTFTFDGTLSGDTMSIDIDWTDLTSPFCNGQQSGTLTRSGGTVVNPEITPGTVLVTPQILSTQISTLVSDVSSRVGDALRGNSGFARTASGLMYGLDSGLNAGDATIPFGVWVSYAYNDFDNDFAAIKFDGTRHSVLAGADFTPWENTVLGIAFGYENNDIDTDFNGGEQDTDGFTIAPYFGLLLNDILSVDLAAGYSRMDTDQFRRAPGTGTKINSSPNADRWFVTMNFSGVWVIDNWILGASTGGLYAKHAEESFVESDGTAVSSLDTELGQWRISGDAAYSFGAWEPFARVTYENDFEQTKIGVIGGPQPSFDDDNVLVGGGIRYFGTKGISGNLEFYKRLGREDFDEHAITLTIRGEF